MNRIKDVLEVLGISQADFSKMTGISTTSINKMCKNSTQPSLKRLNEFSDILNVSIYDLITNKGRKRILDSKHENLTKPNLTISKDSTKVLEEIKQMFVSFKEGLKQSNSLKTDVGSNTPQVEGSTDKDGLKTDLEAIRLLLSYQPTKGDISALGNDIEERFENQTRLIRELHQKQVGTASEGIPIDDEDVSEQSEPTTITHLNNFLSRYPIEKYPNVRFSDENIYIIELGERFHISYLVQALQVLIDGKNTYYEFTDENPPIELTESSLTIDLVNTMNQYK